MNSKYFVFAKSTMIKLAKEIILLLYFQNDQYYAHSTLRGCENPVL